MVARRLQSPARWPFWVLLAAWTCANTPQIAVYAVVTWIVEARSFSHQYELTRSVAHILKKESSPSRVGYLLRKAANDRPSQPLPPIPDDAVLRKVQLAIQLSDGLSERVSVPRRFAMGETSIQERVRPEPLHGPPRAGAV